MIGLENLHQLIPPPIWFDFWHSFSFSEFGFVMALWNILIGGVCRVSLRKVWNKKADTVRICVGSKTFLDIWFCTKITAF